MSLFLQKSFQQRKRVGDGEHGDDVVNVGGEKCNQDCERIKVHLIRSPFKSTKII